MAGRKRELAVIKVREILRLKELGLSNRQVADSNRVSPATVHDYWQAAIARGVRLSEFADRTDQELLEALGKRSVAKERLKNEPDYRRLQQELSRKGVTLQLLWEEYHQQYPDGYRYSRFCELYDEWLDAQELSMPQRHKAGEKLFVDYAGRPYRSTTVQPIRSNLKQHCSSLLSEQVATPTLKLPVRNPLPHGLQVTCAPSPSSVALLKWWCQTT